MNHPSPKKSNTGLIVGVILAIVLAAGGAVAVTGFFLSDEKAEQDDDKTTAPGGSDIDQVNQIAEQAATAINTRDESLAKSITCVPQGKPDFSKMPADMKAEVTGEPTMDGSTKAKVPFKFTTRGRSEDESLRMEKQEGRWCID